MLRQYVVNAIFSYKGGEAMYGVEVTAHNKEEAEKNCSDPKFKPNFLNELIRICQVFGPYIKAPYISSAKNSEY